MYRADNFIVPQVEKLKTGVYHNLAEAIRQGCIMRPKKVRGHFRIGKDAACALGAAAVGGWKCAEAYDETYVADFSDASREGEASMDAAIYGFRTSDF
jgi:hypothetical protein